MDPVSLLPLTVANESTQVLFAVTTVENLKSGDENFQKSFSSPAVESEDGIPMPNATCKMRASCRKPASSKNMTAISCPEHASLDMKPFTPSTRKRKQVLLFSFKNLYILFDGT